MVSASTEGASEKILRLSGAKSIENFQFSHVLEEMYSQKSRPLPLIFKTILPPYKPSLSENDPDPFTNDSTIFSQ